MDMFVLFRYNINGDIMASFKDLTNSVFGRLTVIKMSKKVQSGNRERYYWLCKCKCVIVKAFYPLLLIVTYKFGVRYSNIIIALRTLGSIIFIQLLRSTVIRSLSKSTNLPRC